MHAPILSPAIAYPHVDQPTLAEVQQYPALCCQQKVSSSGSIYFAIIISTFSKHILNAEMEMQKS